MDYEEAISEKIYSVKNVEENRKYIEQIYASHKIKKSQFSNKDVSLFTFFLQLVSYLKSIGTVPAIDVNAYLKAIHEEIDEGI